MPQKKKLLVAALSALFSLPAWAANSASATSSPITANVSMVNNYVFRGISQTGGKPAIQGGFDLAAASGVYIGAWGSNISWPGDKGVATSGSMELDTYVGMKNNPDPDYTYDLGFLRYNLPGNYVAGANSVDTNELYGSIGYMWLIAKYSRSLGNYFGMPFSKGTTYSDISINYPFPDSTVTLGLHYGQQVYKGASANALKAAGQDPSYADYKVSLAKNMDGYVLSVAYSKTNAATGAGKYYNVNGKDLGKAATIVSLSRTF